MPLNLAIGFHLLIALSVVFLPGLLKQKPKFEDIYTVNLINLAEPAAQPQESPAAPPPPAAKPEPVKPEPVKTEAVPIAEPVKPIVTPEAQIKPVSLKPIKKKVKNKDTSPSEDDIARQKALEKLKRERVAEALKAEQRAAEQARIAAEEAARQQKILEQQLAQIKQQVRAPAPSSTGTASRGGSSSTMGVLEKQYYAAIRNRITQFWSLPEFKNWDPSTEAMVVITIAEDGTITNQFFEKRSNDPTFDQFVRKALQDANPLPAIPPALKKNSYEFGLRFTPERIQ